MMAARSVAAVAAVLVAVWVAGCVPNSFTNPPPARATASPVPSLLPQTYVVGTDATNSALTVLSFDPASGTLTPAAALRRPDGSRTVSAEVPLVDRGCSPGSMNITSRDVEFVCAGSKFVDLLSVTPGPANTVVIDPASVKTCPVGNDPWLLRAADITLIDGPHIAVDVLDHTSGAVSLCVNDPSGFHARPAFSLPAGQVPLDLRLIAAPAGSAYPYYEAFSFSVNGGSGGVAFYGLAETGARTPINQIAFTAADLPLSLDDGCDDNGLLIVAAGPRKIWSFASSSIDGPFTASSLPDTTVPFFGTASGPNAPNQIGRLRLGMPRVPYHAFAATGTLDVFDANYRFIGGSALPGTSLRLRGLSGTGAGYFVSLSPAAPTTSTLSTLKFDGTTLSPRLDVTLNYRLNDFGLARIGFPRPTPSPSPTPAPGTVGNVVLSSNFLIFNSAGQIQTVTATQVGNPNNLFTASPLTCPPGNTGRATITQPSPGTFSVRADSTSGGATCSTDIGGLAGFGVATLRMVL